MSLRLRLTLVTTVTVLLLFGIAEWLSFLHTTALLEQHEAILMETTDHAVALKKLKDTRSQMFLSLTTVRILYAVLTLLLSIAVLNYVWYRVFYRPISRLLAQINIMGRGTWKSALPVNRNDEIGQLTNAFNELGHQLTSTFQSINTSSRLSALALLGNRLVRDINVSRGQLAEATRVLDAAVGHAPSSAPGPPGLRHSLAGAIATLHRVEGKLERLESQFQEDFDSEVTGASAGFKVRANKE